MQGVFYQNPDLLLPYLKSHFNAKVDIREIHAEYALRNGKPYPLAVVDLMVFAGVGGREIFIPVEIKATENSAKRVSALGRAEKQLRRYFRLALKKKIDFPPHDRMTTGVAIVEPGTQVYVFDLSVDPSPIRRNRYPQPHSLRNYFPDSTEDELARLHNACKRGGDPTKVLLNIIASEQAE